LRDGEFAHCANIPVPVRAWLEALRSRPPERLRFVNDSGAKNRPSVLDCSFSPSGLDWVDRTMHASPRLSQLLTPKGHEPLVTLDDACRYILALPPEVADTAAWRNAARVALAALDEPPTETTLNDITRRIELALFVTCRLTLGWRRATEHHCARQAAGS